MHKEGRKKVAMLSNVLLCLVLWSCCTATGARQDAARNGVHNPTIRGSRMGTPNKAKRTRNPQKQTRKRPESRKPEGRKPESKKQKWPTVSSVPSVMPVPAEMVSIVEDQQAIGRSIPTIPTQIPLLVTPPPITSEPITSAPITTAPTTTAPTTTAPTMAPTNLPTTISPTTASPTMVPTDPPTTAAPIPAPTDPPATAAPVPAPTDSPTTTALTPLPTDSLPAQIVTLPTMISPTVVKPTAMIADDLVSISIPLANDAPESMEAVVAQNCCQYDEHCPIGQFCRYHNDDYEPKVAICESTNIDNTHGMCAVATPGTLVLVGDDADVDGVFEPASAFPLQACQGDCDTNADCDDGLLCFQRRGDYSDVVPPGCTANIGGGGYGKDYCYNATNNDGEGYLFFVGNNGLDDDSFQPSDEYPLRMCGGDCDSDDDCEGSLRCFQRYDSEAVPGCDTYFDDMGVLEDDGTLDFCFDPYGFLTYVGDDMNGEDTFSLLADKSVYPLGVCEGDCDSDDDCAGNLKCFQRDENEHVPGCLDPYPIDEDGYGENTGSDFCYNDIRQDTV